MRDLLSRLVSTDEPDLKARLFHQVDLSLWVHARVEEEVFYPAFRDAVSSERERGMYFEALEEHRSADRLLEDMRRTDAGSAVFQAQCKVLKEQVEHHAGEEEKGMFAVARRVMGSGELRDLAVRCKGRRDEILGGAPQDAAPPTQRWWTLGLRRHGDITS